MIRSRCLRHGRPEIQRRGRGSIVTAWQRRSGHRWIRETDLRHPPRDVITANSAASERRITRRPRENRRATSDGEHKPHRSSSPTSTATLPSLAQNSPLTADDGDGQATVADRRTGLRPFQGRDASRDMLEGVPRGATRTSQATEGHSTDQRDAHTHSADRPSRRPDTSGAEAPPARMRCPTTAGTHEPPRRPAPPAAG